MRRYTSAARAPGALWADTSGVASSRRTEWWAGARGHRSTRPGLARAPATSRGGWACGAWSGRARAIRLVVAPPAVWSDEREDGVR